MPEFKKSYMLTVKEEIEKQPVRCILVDSESHLFLITDKEDDRWHGGNHYPYKALYTRNTGGGKSVAVQNIILSCISHRDKVALGLIDPKIVEFSNYKGMNGIVGVANSVQESVELLRIARQVMYRRNKEMAELGIKNIGEYHPTHRTDIVYITGREYNKDEIIRIRENGVEREMTAGELADYLRED